MKYFPYVLAVVTAAVGVAANFFVAEHYDVLSLTILFVLPVGAFGVGFLCFSGLYLGGRVANRKLDFKNGMAFCAILSFFVVLAAYYLPYYLLNIEGSYLRDHIGFFQYLQISLSETTLSLKGNEIGQAGWYGYAVPFLQYAGVLFAAYTVLVALNAAPFCEKCVKFMKKDRKYVLQFETSADFETFHGKYLENKKARDASFFLEKAVQEQKDGPKAKGTQVKMNTDLLACPDCGAKVVRDAVLVKSGGKWQNAVDFARCIPMDA